MTVQKQHDISVLYVEDDDFTGEQIREFLQSHVREVVPAANGADGLELFRKISPDLIVTDILMPVMDGLRMATEIRTLNKDVPIIVTTAYSEASYMIDAIETGVDYYLMKPIELEKLGTAIRKCAELIDYRKMKGKYDDERERLIGELQDALAKVKLLSGLLPICASCKKIRDDQGYWQQIEAYIITHSEAEFSHGMCPECAKKLFGDRFTRKMPETK